ELRNPAFLAHLKRLQLPLVLVSPSLRTDDIDTIEIDDRGGAKAAAEHLLGLGHTRIAWLGGAPSSRPSQDREAGFLDALRAAEIPLSDALRSAAGWRFEDGYRAAAAWMALPERPSAIFAASDLLALGAIQAIRDAGLQVPNDISVLGFDDIELAAESRPQLSTMRVERYEIGELAARLLIERIEGKRKLPLRVTVPTRLVLRQSSAAPAHALLSR